MNWCIKTESSCLKQNINADGLYHPNDRSGQFWAFLLISDEGPSSFDLQT